MGWHGSAMTLGSALGAPLAGLVMDRAGPGAGFLTVGLLEPPGGGAGLAGRPRTPGALRGAGGSMSTRQGCRIVGEDWYARDLAQETFTDCELVDCDLTEVTTTDCAFDRVVFRNVRLNATRHERTRFVGCSFEGTSLFDAALLGCKLTGSRFGGCTLRPLTVDGGDWSYVELRDADLRGLELTG